MAPKADAKAGGGDKKGGDKKGGDKKEGGDKKGGDKKGGDKKDADKKGGDKKKDDKKADAKADKKADAKGKGDAKEAKADKKDAKPAASKTDTKKDEKAAAKPKGEGKGKAEEEDTPAAQAKARGPFRRFFYRGLEVHNLLDLTHGELMKLMTSRVRRRFQRGQIPMGLVRKLRKEKNAAAKAGEKPKTIKTHHRNMIIVPEMVGSMVGVYNGLNFTQVEVKPDMIGHYLGEFSITYKPVKHGRPGVGSTGTANKLIPLK